MLIGYGGRFITVEVSYEARLALPQGFVQNSARNMLHHLLRCLALDIASSYHCHRRARRGLLVIEHQQRTLCTQ
jgi:hypothetical protein